jgi:hypothetical protein
MTTKIQDKTQEKTRTQQPRSAPAPEDIHAAYQCHTLAQLLYGQIAARFPQVVSTPYGVAPPPMSGVAGATWTPTGPDIDTLRRHDPTSG